MAHVKPFLSLGEFAQDAAAEIFNPYLALQAWAGTPGSCQDVKVESALPGGRDIVRTGALQRVLLEDSRRITEMFSGE